MMKTIRRSCLNRSWIVENYSCLNRSWIDEKDTFNTKFPLLLFAVACNNSVQIWGDQQAYVIYFSSGIKKYYTIISYPGVLGDYVIASGIMYMGYNYWDKCPSSLRICPSSFWICPSSLGCLSQVTLYCQCQFTVLNYNY